MKLSLVRAPGIETLDSLTKSNTAFATFAELLNAPAYTPSLDVVELLGPNDPAPMTAADFDAMLSASRPCSCGHFGDHDPSGIDMTRDIGERLALFGANNLEIRRMALNMDQVREYNPPPNPAKQTDSRFKDYESKFGDESWELDALEPDVLISLVRTAVDEVTNPNQWAEDEERESTMREALTAVSNRWDEVAEYALKPKPEKKPRKKSK